MDDQPKTRSVKDKESLIEKWESDIKVVSRAHYDAAVSASRKNFLFGIPAIVFSAIVGSTVFGALTLSPEKHIAFILAALSLISAILSALQTFLRWPEVSEKHRVAGGKFGALLKELEHKKVTLNIENLEFNTWCDQFTERWNSAAADSPALPRSIWLRHLGVEGRINEQIIED